jgi:hypothetical protein
MPNKHVAFHHETDPLKATTTDTDDDYGVFHDADGYDNFDPSEEAFVALKSSVGGDSNRARESMAAERLSIRLLAIADDDEEEHDRILRESLHLVALSTEAQKRKSIRVQQQVGGRIGFMIVMVLGGFILLGIALYVGAKVIGPPSQPVGPYELVERQVSNKTIRKSKERGS